MMTSVNRSLCSVLVLALLWLTACGKGDQPANSDAAIPPHGKTGVREGSVQLETASEKK